MRKKVAITQSNYIPWKGYFDQINQVDEVIFYDDMQYTRRDWRNRNKIKTAAGSQWLTIPVEVKGKYFQKIKDTMVSDPSWNVNHWKTISHNYARAKYFKEYREQFENLYLGVGERCLSQINLRFISGICNILGIKTKLSRSMDYELVEGKNQRLVDLCRKSGAAQYYSGPAARDYMDEALFNDAGISVHYMDYSGYPEYEQSFPPFEHSVSIIDLLFNVGPDAPKYMKSFRTTDLARCEGIAT